MMAFGAKIKLTVDTSGASAFRKQIQDYTDKATAKNPIVIKNLSVNSKTADQLAKKIQSQINSAQKGIVVNIKDINADGAIKNLRSQIEIMLRGLKIDGVQAFMSTGSTTGSINGAITEQNELATAINNAEREIIEEKAALQELGRIQSTLNSTFGKISNISSTENMGVLLGEYETLNTKIQELKLNESARTSENVSNLAKEIIAVRQKTAAILEQESAAKKAAASEKQSAQNTMASQQKIVSLKSQINNYILSNSRAYRAYGDSLDAMVQELSSGADMSMKRLGEIRTSFYKVKDGARVAGIEGKTFFDTLKSGWEKFGGWSIVTRSMTAAYSMLRKMITAVKELDAAMTELKKVTDLTEQSYEIFLSKASNLSQSIGASLADTVNATADFARLGYDINESANLAEAALVYKNVGDGIDDVSIASESLISTIKAFGIEADNAMGIVDKFNEVGNNFAISSEGIGTALQKSASSLAAAGSSLEESIALATGMNAVLQNPEVVGTTLKTMSMYLRAAKTEAEEAGESTEGMANSVSELRDEILKLTNNKVDIMIDDENFKDPYQIMKELSEVWDDIADVDRANILELTGGKRNATAITSLLTNFADAENALSTAMNAAGSATAENEKYMDSISGKMEIVSSKFETLSNSLINNELVKGIVDIGGALLDVLNFLEEYAGLLPIIAQSIVLIKARYTSLNMSEMAAKVSTLSSMLIKQKGVTEQVAVAVSSLSAKEKKLLADQIQTAAANKLITKEQESQILSTLGLATAEGTLTVANKGLAASFKSMMASIPVWGWIALAITVVIEAVTALTSAVKKNKQEMIDSANEIVDAYGNAQDTYKSNTQSLKGMREEFERLSDGVDENGNNVKLTADEYETYLSLIDQIVNISPDICQGYDNEGRAILNYKTALDDAIASQNTYLENQRNIYLSSGEEIFDGKAEEWKDASEELGKAAGANDLSDKSLDDALVPGIIESIFNMEKAQKKTDAWHDALEELGIAFDGADTWRTATDDVMQMYEKADEMMVLLRNSGAYTEEELTKIEDRLHALAGSYTTLSSIEREQVNYLSEWAKDNDWYKNIPTGALDEFTAGLYDVNDPLLSYNDNIAAASKYGSEFSKSISSKSSQDIINMSKGLENGSVSLEDYNKAIEDFKAGYEGSDAVLDALIDFFNSLSGVSTGAAEDTEDSVSKIKTAMDSFGNAKDVISNLSEAYSDLYEDGSVSFGSLSNIVEDFSDVLDENTLNEYINSLASAEGNTAETANILSDLTKKAVEAKIGADNLANANVNVVASMLEEAGVANSLVIAEEMIAKAKAEAAIQSINLADASSITKEWLDNLTTSTGLTEEEIYNLIIAEILFNEQKLTTSQQIEALTNLAVAAGIAREELGKVYSTDFVGPLPEGSESMSPDEYANRIREKIGAAISSGNGTTVQFTPQTSGSSTDKELEAWNKLVAEQKHLLETDQITKEQYYEWLESAYKENISATEEHADEIRSIEEELYNWEKEKIKENIALKEAQLENQLLYGEISEEEYQRQLTDAYSGARQEIESNTELYGVDEQERLSEINSYLDKEKSAYNAAYDAEHQQLEHKLAMNLISEEQYLIELQALYDKYYKDNEMYSEEAMEVEEEIYDLRVELVEKWSQAAVDAIEAMAEATESMIDAIKDLIQDSIDTHEENFNLEKQLLDHALAMNYISEEQYYSDLDKLYKKYFKDKNLYMEQYWENQEEIYQHEQDMLEDSASAIEDIHAKVVDMIKQELEDAIDAIEETKDKYLDLIEIRREAMNDMKDEEDYEKERAEKLSSISELQRQLNALAYDTSAEGVAKYKQVYAELQKAKDELAEFENDHAYEKMNDQLDKEAESIEVGADAEISGLEELLDNNEYLVQEAWDRMDGMSKELFDQLNEYTKKHSTSIKDDITDVWNTATSAVGDYTNAYNAYLGITGQIGKSGMTDGEYAQDSARTTGKQISGWVSTALNFGASMLEIGVGLMSSFMSIAGSLMGGSAGSFLGMGSGLVGTFGGLGTGILSAITSILGSFATGTNYVPKTGVYRTDEFGEELKLFKNPTSGNYTLLTEGSKVFTNEQVGRLISIINSPNSLLDTSGIMNVSQVKVPSIPNTQNTNQEVSVQNVFQIESSDPEGVAAEIERKLPEIAEYTVGKIVNGMSNSGIKRITQKLV